MANLDLTLREHDRREAKNSRQQAGSEEAIRAAQAALAEQIRGRLAETLGPFKTELGALADTLAAQRDVLLAALAAHPGFEALRAELAQMNEGLRAARPHVTYDLGLGRKLEKHEIGAGLACAFLVSLFMQCLIARVLPDSWVAAPISRALFGSVARAECVLDGGRFAGAYCITRAAQKAEERP